MQRSNNMVSLAGQGIYRQEVAYPLSASRYSSQTTDGIGSVVANSTSKIEMKALRDMQLDTLKKQAAQREAAAAQREDAARALMGMRTGAKSVNSAKRTGGKRRRNVRQTRRRRR